MSSKISVVGSGYVGTTTAALLAAIGYEVTAVDIDPNKVETINSGQAPFFEDGLDNLIQHSLKTGTLKASTNYDSVKDANIIFSCVGTPDKPDGSPNMTYVDAVAKTVSELAKPGALFVQKSTVPVGTGERLQKVVSKQEYISNPEFLREGTAIVDSIFYDRLVIGCEKPDCITQLEELFVSVRNKSKELLKIAGLATDRNDLVGETIATGVNSAELIKVTANAFLALKISFANSVAKLADRSGADINEVMNGVGSDKRIGKAFLNAGRGYGGGCFPKDVSGLISVSIDHGVDFGIMTAATDLNESMGGYIVNKANEKRNLTDQNVAVLGLSFKAGTSDCRKSPSIKIANTLVGLGANVTAYDPQANEEAKELLDPSINVCDSYDEAIQNAKTIFIATDWQELVQIPIETYTRLGSDILIVDCMNCLNKTEIESSGLTYIGVGR